MKRCPCCGQAIPPKLVLGPVKRRIYDELLLRPCTAEILRERVWADVKSRSNLHAHIMQLRQRLRPHGLTIRPDWNGGRHEYPPAYRIRALA
jgi:hypothetical protein